MKWQSYKLKEVGEVVTGNTPPTTQREYYGTQYKFIKPTDMREGQRYVPITEEYYSELAYQKYRKSLLPVNTPCVVTIGSLGKKMCLTDEPSFTNQAVNAVIPNENFDGVFLYYCLRTRLPYVKQLDSGTTSGRENVSKSSFSNIVIEAPSLAIQKRIASILSAYDNQIENNNKRIKILEQMAENLYKEWFVRFRFPGHETTPLENGIPKGWNQVALNEICLVNEKNISAKDDEKEILYLDTSSITHNFIENTETFKVKDAPGRARRIVKRNSIIFSTVRPSLCHYGIMKGIPQNLVVSTGFAVFDTKHDIANIVYLFLSSQSVIEYCQTIAEGAVATYPTITAEEIGKIKITLPPIQLAECWNAKFESIFLKMQNLQQQNQNLIKQRDLLLPRLMSGKLAV